MFDFVSVTNDAFRLADSSAVARLDRRKDDGGFPSGECLLCFSVYRKRIKFTKYTFGLCWYYYVALLYMHS